MISLAFGTMTSLFLVSALLLISSIRKIQMNYVMLKSRMFQAFYDEVLYIVTSEKIISQPYEGKFINPFIYVSWFHFPCVSLNRIK